MMPASSNPLHPGNPMFNFSELIHTEDEIRAELTRRGLPASGNMTEVSQLFLKGNDFLASPEGQSSIRLAKLNDLRVAWLNALPKFHRFSSLPIEIRLMIWKLSLPGTRVLVVKFDDTKLYFPRLDNQENPAMLSVCRESRQIALQKYRLWFSTTYLYADKDGGDILYLGYHGEDEDLLARYGTGLWKYVPPYDLWYGFKEYHLVQAHPKRIMDLRQIKRIAIHPSSWQSRYMWLHTNNHSSTDPHMLRKDLRDLVELQEIILIQQDADDASCQSRLTAGHIELRETQVRLRPERLRQRYLGLYDAEHKNWEKSEMSLSGCIERYEDCRDFEDFYIRSPLPRELCRPIDAPELIFMDAARVTTMLGKDWGQSLGRATLPSLDT